MFNSFCQTLFFEVFFKTFRFLLFVFFRRLDYFNMFNFICQTLFLKFLKSFDFFCLSSFDDLIILPCSSFFCQTLFLFFKKFLFIYFSVLNILSLSTIYVFALPIVIVSMINNKSQSLL